MNVQAPLLMGALIVSFLFSPLVSSTEFWWKNNSESLRHIADDAERLIADLRREQELVRDGMSMGSRRETLQEVLAAKRAQIQMVQRLKRDFFENVETLQFQLDRAERAATQLEKEVAEKDETIAYQNDLIGQLRGNLDDHPMPHNEYLCTLTLFRNEFFGISVDREIAQKKALEACGRQYNLNLQCRRAQIDCRR